MSSLSAQNQAGLPAPGAGALPVVSAPAGQPLSGLIDALVSATRPVPDDAGTLLRRFLKNARRQRP